MKLPFNPCKTTQHTAAYLILFLSTTLLIGSCSKGDPAPNDPCAGVTISVTGTTNNPTGGASNGNIIATASGASGFTYSLNGGAFQATGQFANLAPGSYSVTAKSSAGCTGSASFTLTATGGCTGVIINITPTVTGVTPCVTASGSIAVAANGGTGPYTYSINSTTQFQSSNLFSNLNQGTYTIGVRDANGCTSTQGSITVGQRLAGPLFTAVKAIVVAKCVSCHGASGGNGGINLDGDCNIVSAKDRIKARAVDATSNIMPPAPQSPLSAIEKQAITTWINAGGRVTD
ncbi:MAG: c-type cytochrome [Sphingomonadales bacterium]